MSSISPTLLVLAAGMGSRYGGLKQMDDFYGRVTYPADKPIVVESIQQLVSAGEYPSKLS